MARQTAVGSGAYQSKFDGSDTAFAVDAFLAKGGTIQKCPNHSPGYGDMRAKAAISKQEASKQQGQ